MTLATALVNVWKQVMVDGAAEVDVDGARQPVGRTRNKGLKTVGFRYEGVTIEGIEQNPETASRWAKLAQSGQRILQFRAKGKYIANVCEGRLTRYPSWKALGLPD